MKIKKKLLLALGVCAAVSAPAQAATVNDLGISLAQIRALNAQLTAPVVAPGIAFGSPVGFGAGWGQVFVGIGGQTIPPGAEYDVDGSVVAGFGIGDPYRWVGLETSVTAISVRDDFGEDGNVNVKLHRALPWRAGVAVGVENTGRWGDAEDTSSSNYIAYTQVIDLSPDTPRHTVPLAFNIGLGSDRFVDPDSTGDTDGVGVFGSIAIAPFRQIALIADWTGRDANAAVSFVPFRRTPLVVTLGAINLGERLNNDVEFAGGIGYLYQF